MNQTKFSYQRTKMMFARRYRKRQNLTFAIEILIHLVILLGAHSVIVSSLQARSRETPAAALADGRPWRVSMVENGRQSTLTIRPDGTATMGTSGMMSLSPTWRATPEGFCLKPSVPMSNRCLALSKIQGEFNASDNGKLMLELRR